MQWIKENKGNLWVVILALVYIIVNMVFTYHEFYYFNLVPIAVLLVYLALARLDILYFIVIACTPLSIPLIEFFRSSPIDFYIPTEPILFGIMIIVIFKLAQKNFISRKVLNHPVTLAILFNLFWIFMTAITSSLPLVSFKYLLARIWFLTTFYLLAIYLFRKPRNMVLMVWAYTLPLLIVIGYAINRHLDWGLFDKQAAHTVMNPFYRDHTSYGAVMAMMIFAFAGVNLQRNQSILRKMAASAIFVVLVIALILSYTRASWVSVLFSLVILAATFLRIKFKYLAIVAVVLLTFFYSNWFTIQNKLEKNKQDSSTNITEHLQSVTNIATDESNLERLNRWAAAFRMFKERPVFGWGPGTYMFNYAPYQLSSQKTSISTNFGDLGNAHSEYIGPLAESGVLGMVSFVLIAVMGLITGYRVYFKVKERHLRIVVLSTMLAFITYLIHGFLNNFLDTDKASSLFWGFLAFLVSLDIYYKEGRERNILVESDERIKEN